MKTCIALLAMGACLRATATPSCPVDGFYPTSGNGANVVSRAVAEPWPAFAHDDEEPRFDLIEVGGQFESGWQPIFEVLLLGNDRGAFRVVLLRVKRGAGGSARGAGVIQARDLPAPIALRLHEAVVPVLGRTHYPAASRQKSPPAAIECTDGETLYVTVSNTGNRFHEMTGEARPYGEQTEAGAVEALGHALRDYALGRIDERGFDGPLELVEAHNPPANKPPR